MVQQNETEKRKAVISHIVKFRLFRDRRIINRFQNVFFQSLGRSGFIKESKSMWEVIYFLCGAHFSNDSVSVSDIYHSIDVSKTATISCLTSLEQIGVLEKISDAIDRRRKIIQLTPKCSKIIAGFVDDCVEQFSDLIIFGENVERKNSEKVLKRSAERSLQIAMASADWFWELDKNLRYVWLSDDFEKKTDLKISDYIGKTRWQKFEDGFDNKLPHYLAGHRTTMQDHLPFRDFDFQYIRPSGEIRNIRASGSPMFNERGEFSGYIGATTDVTQVKKSEWAIVQSEEKFREFAKLSTDWFWETDETHTFSWFSEEMSEVTGQESILRIGAKRWENHAPLTNKDRLQMQQHREDLDLHRPFRNFIYRARRQRGRIVWTKISGNPQFDLKGVFTGYRGTAQDVTGQVKIDQERQADADRLRLVSDFSSVWCWEMDEHFQMTWASIGLWECTGETLDEIIGTTRWQYHDPRNDSEIRQMDEHRNILKSRQPFRNFVYRARFKAGGQIWYRVSGAPMFDGEGVFIGYQGVASDFTEQQQRVLLSSGQKLVLDKILHRYPVDEIIKSISDMINLAAPSIPVAIFQISGNEGTIKFDNNNAITYLATGFGFSDPVDLVVDFSTELKSKEWRNMLIRPSHAMPIAYSETQSLWASAMVSQKGDFEGLVVAVCELSTDLNNEVRDVIEIATSLTNLAFERGGDRDVINDVSVPHPSNTH